jgi:hypothetical protein
MCPWLSLVKLLIQGHIPRLRKAPTPMLSYPA